MTESDLLRNAEFLSNFSESATFVANVSKALEAGNITKDDESAILLFGFRSLLDATKDVPVEGERAILNWVVPACLEASQEPNHNAYKMRELLVAWVDQYPDEHKVPLRARVLAVVQKAIHSDSPIPAMWTASAVGLRTPQLERNLQRLTEQNNRVGDVAIECLASLFPSVQIRRGIARKVIRRLATRKARDFYSAITAIRDSRFIPALSRKLIGDDEREMFITSLLGRIADMAPLNEGLQARVWRVFRRALDDDNGEIRGDLLTGDGITLCNAVEVVPRLTRLLERQPGSHVVYAMLKDCVRPGQLKGWSLVDKRRLKALLSPAATAVTGNRSRSLMIEDDSRRKAWDTALAAGLTDIADWLAAVLVETAGSFEKADALSFCSYYQLEGWPEEAEKLVLQEFRMEESQSLVIADRAAGVQFFLAIATRESLRILLNAGLTAHGSPLRSTSLAVANLATWLAQSGPDAVVQQLLQVCESEAIGNRRMLAVAGLENLADQRLIPPTELPRLARVAQDSSLPSYAISAAIWAMSCYSESAFLPEYVSFVKTNLTDTGTDPEVRFQCFQSLVRLGIWDDCEDEFIERLELRGPALTLAPSKGQRYQRWQALLLTQLAIRKPQKFLQATIDVVNHAGADAVHAVLQVCTRTHKRLDPEFEALIDAAIARTLRVFNSNYAEGDMLTLIAQLAPMAFVRAEWQPVWGAWMPQARAALARAIERNASAFKSDVEPRLLDLLEALLSDSVYEVRRIAARVLAKINSGKLSGLCHQWAESGNSGLRLRVAGIAHYMPPDPGESMDNSLLRALYEDPEKRIRQAAADGITKLRHRAWAAQLLELIQSSRDRPPNEWVAECYRYGRALAVIGDDETLEGLRAFLSNNSIAPNVRNWLQSVAEAVDQHWKDVTRNWPEPTLPWAGTLEEVITTFSFDDREVSGRLLLWRQRQSYPGGQSWGGSFLEPPGFQSLRYLSGLGIEPRPLRIMGRKDAHIWIASVSSSGLVSFVGNGPYPEILEPDSTSFDNS